jgi:hypothetical protein
MLSRRAIILGNIIPRNINYENKPFVYQSNNKKFLYQQVFYDNDQSVTVYTKKEWYDPITKKVMTKVDNELFILHLTEH